MVRVLFVFSERTRTGGESPGSEGSAAGGRCSDPSEWLRSADEEAAPTATKMPGTATGHRHQINETRTEWFGFYLFLSERTRTHLNVAPRWGVTRHRHHWKDRHSPLFLLAGRRYILEFASVLSYDKSRKTRLTIKSQSPIFG